MDSRETLVIYWNFLDQVYRLVDILLLLITIFMESNYKMLHENNTSSATRESQMCIMFELESVYT